MSRDEISNKNPIAGTTQLVGLIGWPLSHSLSPAMHNAAAADLGLDLVYVPLPVRPGDLPAAIRGLAALGFRGVNVTIPYKEQTIPLLDKVDPATQAIGAVNTIVITNPRSPLSAPQCSGFNTDWSGFLADLAELGIEVAGQECLVLGAGGSARAVVYGLASHEARVHVFARREEQARQLVADLQPGTRGKIESHHWNMLEDVALDCPTSALVVNTTPLGMPPKGGFSPWPDELPFPAKATVYDLVYNPAETRLMKQARAAGCRVSNGLGMLLQQGVQAFKLWTGYRPSVEIMARAIGRQL